MDGAYVYFAHSYAAPADAPGVALVTNHGRTYCAGLAQDNLFAVQFHPEKSQKVGLALLERFVAI
jgi:glutamine amidotransferase